VVTVTVLIALLVCLIPTTIGGLLPAIGIAGMDRMIQANVIAMSGRAVEAAGDVDVLLLDKTGTITLGNRQAVAFVNTNGISPDALADAAQISSLSDETPEGRSIVILAKEKYGLRERHVHELGAVFIPFTAQTRMSGVDLNDGRRIRKGAADAVEAYVKQQGGIFPAEVKTAVDTFPKFLQCRVEPNQNFSAIFRLRDDDLPARTFADSIDRLRSEKPRPGCHKPKACRWSQPRHHSIRR
jgi:K+-transporting ATPase ATPase B chain